MKSMNNNFKDNFVLSNRAAGGTDTIFGTMAIFCSLLAPGAFFIVSFAAGVSGGIVDFGRVFLGGVLFTAVWVVLGIRALVRVSRAGGYAKIFDDSRRSGASRISVGDVTEKTGKPLRTVSAELTVLRKRGYFKGLEFDLDGKDIVFAGDTVVIAESSDRESKTVYKTHVGVPVWVILAAFATFFPFLTFNPVWLILGGVAAAGAAVLTLKFFPVPTYFYEAARTSPKLKRPNLTGHGDLDAMLGSIHANKVEIVRLRDSISSSAVRSALGDILGTLDEITEYVAANPEKAKNLRQFANYYLPTTVDLLRNYEDLESKPDSLKGENIADAMAKIEGVTTNMADVFRREYDDLFADRVMDISAEVGVLQSIIKEAKQEL
jgi:hypothetical protein